MELWQLFPIFLTEHKGNWDEWYKAEEQRLYGTLLSEKVKINHIGSTAINDIWAKSIIDILVEIPVNSHMDKIKEILLKHGYVCMSEESNRISFNMGYTENGFSEKVYHLHLRYAGDNDELYFRDYMNDCPALAKYRLGIGDFWIALRIEEMIRTGKLKTVTEAPKDMPVYHRILKKT